MYLIRKTVIITNKIRIKLKDLVTETLNHKLNDYEKRRKIGNKRERIQTSLDVSHEKNSRVFSDFPKGGKTYRDNCADF